MPEYRTKFKDEAAWIGVSTAIGALAAAVLHAVGIDDSLGIPAGAAVGYLARLIIGALLPEPATP